MIFISRDVAAIASEEGVFVAATLYYDKDATLDPLVGKTIAIIGYGSQGHAHAQNLRDTGIKVIVGLHEGSKSKAKAKPMASRVHSVADAAEAGRRDHDPRSGPDPGQDLHRVGQGELTAGKTLLFAHGFAVRFGFVTPPTDVNVVMIAPKARVTASVSSSRKASACRR